MELIAPPPAKAGKKIEIQKKSIPNSKQQQQHQQQQSRRHSTGNVGAANNGSNAPRRKIGVFGAPKFLPIAEEQTHARAESLNTNNGTNQQQRKNSKSGSGPGSAEAGISAWMNRRISSGQLEAARSGKDMLEL